MQDIRLLSPAGSRESFEAAIEYGADAVYLGGKRFGARKYADNFDDTQMRDVLRHAHLNDIEVYVTVNTLANHRDLPQMVKYIADLYSWGADAIIVQDIGAALLARRHIPDLPVHASTQMTLHNRPQVEWAEGMGLSAVVVSREVPIGAIKPMFKGLTPKPEVFVHGALCYSFSGQCLFSHVHQERSANKGACAQPCRRAYKLVKENNGKRNTVRSRGQYPLCMRDLCTVEEMDRIVGSGVRVLKIEGRMKGEQYVKTTTSIYRKYLDLALNGKFKGVDKKDLDLLWLAYNREFTKGYLFDSRFAQVKSRLRPDNRGLLLGNIINIDNRKETMTVRPVTDIVPNNKDVIKVVTDHDYRIKNLNLHVKHIKTDSQGNLVMNSHKDATKGDQVYLATHNIGDYLEPLERGVAVEINVNIKKGEPIRMTAKGGGMDVETTGTQEVTKAKTSPLTKESVLKQVLKTSPYQVRIKDANVQMDEDCFVTISELNTVRRALYEKVEGGWLKTKYPLPKRLKIDMRRALGDTRWGKKRKGPGKKGSRLCAITNDVRDLEILRDEGLNCIYLDCLYSLSNDKNVEKALSSIKRFGGKDLFIKTPRISMPWELKALEGFLKKLDPKTEFGGFRAGNWGAYRMIRSVFPKAEVHADVSFNVTNFVSADMLLDDFQRITLSPEMEAYDMVDLARSCKRPSGLDVLAGGRHAIMVTRDCLLGSSYEDATTGPKGFTDKHCKRSCTEGFWFLKDYKKRHYPLWMDPDCFGHLFNHKVLETDHKVLNKARLSSFTVDLRGFPSVNERSKALGDFRSLLGGRNR